jgi:aryl-alcohol dehydrogenase-like predicted oxidoreductase
MQYFDFSSHKASRIFKGNWQLSGGHGQVDRRQAIDDLFAYVEHGVNVFDMGDIYTGAEETVGLFLNEYRERFGARAADKLRMHTKFVPDMDALEDLSRRDVRSIITRSLHRLGVERLHLVQFHWWDYEKGDFVKAAQYLDELRQEGLIEAIGLTNFDCDHTRELLEAGIPIVSNQVQFSLLDPRPFNGMLALAEERNLAIFCYGTLAGGLLAGSRPGEETLNRSHTKYSLIVDEVGTGYYHAVLRLLDALASKYNTSAANIAITYILQTPGVSSAILGPRNTKHIQELDQLDNLSLSEEDYKSLYDLQTELLRVHSDDVYSYERDINGPHGRIMKYNLNRMR